MKSIRSTIAVWVYAFPHSHRTSALLPTWEAPMLTLVLAAAALTLGSLGQLDRSPTVGCAK